jgi:hypothetical protein
MSKIYRGLLVTVVLAASASLASAGDLKLTIGNGRVTLIAQDVPLRQILAEWERIGKTTIVNGDKLTGPPMTLQVVDMPEREVLEMLLRSASGYIAAPRHEGATGLSVFESVRILPTSKGPVGGAASLPPPPFSRNMPQPQPMPITEDDEPVVETPVMPPGMNPQPGVPGMNGQPAQQQQPPLTAPRPGMLPASPNSQPVNPYGTAPGQLPLPPGVRPPGGPGGGGGL